MYQPRTVTVRDIDELCRVHKVRVIVLLDPSKGEVKLHLFGKRQNTNDVAEFVADNVPLATVVRFVHHRGITYLYYKWRLKK